MKGGGKPLGLTGVCFKLKIEIQGEIKKKMKKLSILLITIFFSSLLLAAESRVALVIGNSNYDVGRLRNPINDATDIANALEKLNFKVIRVFDGNRSKMINGINSFRDSLKNSDIALFFYSGHGVQIKGENYLIPLNQDFLSEDDYESYAVSMDYISKRMTEAKNKIVILDACRNNPLSTGRSGVKGLALITNSDDNMMIVYATAPYKVAKDGVGKNSPFTESLLTHINIKEEFESLFKKIISDVRNKTNGEQIPYKNSSISNDIYLAGRPESPPTNTASNTTKVETSTMNANDYNKRGLEYSKKKDYDNAIADYNQAIKLNPNYVDAYYNRGVAYSEKGDYNSAIADLNQTIKLDPNYARAYTERGFAYLGKGDYDSAIADCNQAIKLNPNDTEAYNNRGLAYYLKRDYDSAISDYNQAIKLDPNYISAYYNRSAVYFGRKEDYDSAIADYNQLIRLDPNSNNYNNRGFAYYLKKDYNSAIADYSQAIKLDPNDANAYNGRGDAYYKKGDYVKAKANYEEALRLSPNHIKAKKNLKKLNNN